jgi:diadenosine tetraphosphatase ApaH/serine/threonine PP2A family protein phosphatase
MPRTLIVGDVHGCALELADLLDRAGPDRLICAGDLFTKGPDAAGVWAQLAAAGAEGVLGNHDDHMLRQPERFAGMGLPAEAWSWLRALPLEIRVGPVRVVHAGVPPDGADPNRRTATLVRRWPDDRSNTNPFWWQLYAGEPLVVYGHDAARGLQDHRPRTLGLDTGCVYGGQLTGYLVEADELVQVVARRAWRAIAPAPPGLD